MPWLEQCEINDKLGIEASENLSVREIAADYAFFITSYCVILHEISHVVLGHLDYLNDEMKLNCLNEFQDDKKHNSLEQIQIRKTLEAEADRQAGELLLVFFEYSLGKSGLGECLYFPSRLHAYELYIYAITNLFRGCLKS